MTARIYALAALGGALYFLGWAGFGFWPLSFIAMVPFWAALELGLQRSTRHTLFVGWFNGLVMMAGGYHWLVPFLETFSGYGLVPSALIWLIFSAYLGGESALFALLYRALRRRGWSVSFVALPCWVLIEWVYPSLFPSFLSNSMHNQPLFVQTADLGGPLLVSIPIVLTNLALFETVRWQRGQRSMPRVPWGIAIVAVGLTLAYGAMRIPQIEAAIKEAPSIRLGMVQVNMGVFEKRKDAAKGHRRHLEQSRELEAAGDLDLLVWPESAYVKRLPRKVPFNGEKVRRDVKTPLLFGGISIGHEGDKRRIYNTAFMMDAEGTVHSTYDKRFLLAFGEYLPFGEEFPVLYQLSPNSGRFKKGDHMRPLPFGEWRISTPVCYEDVLPGFTRKMVLEADPHIMINLTNDAWFGDTQEPYIHLAMSQFRAIEHRLYLVRSTNSGVSAVIDPVGRIVASTNLMTRDNIRYDVHMLDLNTIYTRFGDWPGWLCVLAVVYMFIRRRDSETAASGTSLPAS